VTVEMLCLCGHPKSEHAGLAYACWGSCGCKRYRPDIAAGAAAMKADAAPTSGEWWCWTENEPSTFRCRERGHDVRQHFATGGVITGSAELAPAWQASESPSARVRRVERQLDLARAELASARGEIARLRAQLTERQEAQP
jgi:hypothetical protein